jgi:Mrp family chromosome partitioning ATPase
VCSSDLIVSSESGIEASAITLSLGRKLSDSAMRVIAIDMALTKPTLSQIVDEKSIGLTDMLVKGTSFAEAIQGDEQSRLNIISAGTCALTLESMFTHRRMDLTFEAVTRSYDRVIMDFGALNSRYYADKISQLATYVIVVGLGDAKHQQLVDLYARYRETVDLCVMMADATMNETSPAQRIAA